MPSKVVYHIFKGITCVKYIELNAFIYLVIYKDFSGSHNLCENLIGITKNVQKLEGNNFLNICYRKLHFFKVKVKAYILCAWNLCEFVKM